MKPLLLCALISLSLGLTACETVATRETREPEAVRSSRPQYPFELRRQGITGAAVVEFVVDSHGNVQQVKVVKATQPEFGYAAAASIKNWKFKPGLVDGVPVNTRMQMPFVFALDNM